MPTVILSPHFDDAVISCWSVLASHPQVEVVNFFGGTPPEGAAIPYGEEITGCRDAVERARQRAEEDAQALALAGCRGRNLDLLEYPHWLAEYERRPLRRTRTALNLLLKRGPESGRLKEVLAHAAAIPRDAHLYAPAGLGHHPDHVLVRDFACRLMADGADVSFYADQPYCYAYGWPDWVSGAEPDPGLDVNLDWSRQLEPAPVDFGRLEDRAVRLEPSQWEEKIRALRCYRTQFAALEGGANRRVSNPELTGFEVFWDAPPQRAGHGAEAAASGIAPERAGAVSGSL